MSFAHMYRLQQQTKYVRNNNAITHITLIEWLYGSLSQWEVSRSIQTCDLLSANYSLNKNAFQWDAYRPLVVRISQHALLPGGCTCQGVPAWERTCPGGYLPGGVYLPRGVYLPTGCTCPGVYLPGGYLPRYPPWTEWLTHRCKNVTFANFVFGR